MQEDHNALTDIVFQSFLTGNTDKLSTGRFLSTETR